MIIAEQEPTIHINIHFLNFLDFRCKGPNIITPNIPLIIGEDPTAVTIIGFFPNQGANIKERVIDIALNRPKYIPNANKSKTKLRFLKSLGIA